MTFLKELMLDLMKKDNVQSELKFLKVNCIRQEVALRRGTKLALKHHKSTQFKYKISSTL